MRGGLGFALIALSFCVGCSSKKASPPAPRDAAPRAKATLDAEILPAHRTVPDLATAIRELVTPDVRVLGVGEIHQRVDRPSAARSALSRFTDEVLPVVAGRASDLVIETWLPDKNCGGKAEAATAQVEATMQRPASTRSELATLVDHARAAKIQPHPMRLTCDDWTTIAPPGQEIDYAAMLGIVTRELGRIATAANQHSPTKLVITYGGAMHNDLYPNDGLEDWSFAAGVDAATDHHYLELDLYVPEYAAEDKFSQAEPWFPLLDRTGPDHVVVIERGPRSFVVLLPRT